MEDIEDIEDIEDEEDEETQFYYSDYDSPVGKLRLIKSYEGFLTNLLFIELKPKIWKKIQSSINIIEKESFFGNEKQQLTEYFDKKRQQFDLSISIQKGTKFQKQVWRELIKIPYGKTVCYEDIAIKIGKGYASRAVGYANAKNPIPIIIPCHRVIKKNGNLGGYAYGLKIKEKLLNLEKTIQTWNEIGRLC